jgi:hypothetical protein
MRWRATSGLKCSCAAKNSVHRLAWVVCAAEKRTLHSVTELQSKWSTAKPTPSKILLPLGERRMHGENGMSSRFLDIVTSNHQCHGEIYSILFLVKKFWIRDAIFGALASSLLLVFLAKFLVLPRSELLKCPGYLQKTVFEQNLGMLF